MVTQSEEILEQGLIKTLQEMSYEYISIKEEDNLYANFKLQLEKHNRKELALHGRKNFTDKEFDKILLYLEDTNSLIFINSFFIHILFDTE